MFNKDKVKGHNRLVKGKKGFQVTVIKDFFRKKNEDRNRNIGIGLGTTAVIGLGAAILLKKKGINLKSVIKKKKSMVVKVDDVDNLNLTPRPGDGNPFNKEALEKFKVPSAPKSKTASTPTSTKPKDVVVENTKPVAEVSKVVEKPTEIKKNFDPLPDPWTTPIPSKSGVRGSKMTVKKPVTQNRIRRKDNIPDPWTTPIKTKINNPDMVVPKAEEKIIKLLAPAKKKQ